MKLSRVGLVLVLVSSVLAGCKLKDDAQAAPGTIPAPPDVAAVPSNAIKTPSGLAFKVLTVGLGTGHPRPTSTVTIHYTGWTAGGEFIESSVPSGQPASFPLDQMIAGWTEGIQLMVVGEKRRFWIPGALAYDNDPRADVHKGPLVFDIELLAIK